MNIHLETNVGATTGGLKRVFSGIQPSGAVHLGNYLGAIKGWIDRQEQKENFFCIVDLHAITVMQDPKILMEQTRSLSALLLAAGLDPAKSTLFIQSHVSTHAEACWILNCMTPLGWLKRMTQYKDKSTKQESVLTGLIDYPVLMAGDILLYSANEVPVGDDQRQHVELARDIAQRFNHHFGETFVVPEAVIPETGSRIMGLDDPTVKMSKSESDNQGHSIRLLDSASDIERSIKRSVTDSGNEIRVSADPSKAGVNNLLEIYKGISGKSESEVESDFRDARGYGDLKSRVAESVISAVEPIQHRYHQLIKDVTELDKLMSIGAERAKTVSNPKLDEMKQRVGLTLPNSL